MIVANPKANTLVPLPVGQVMVRQVQVPAGSRLVSVSCLVDGKGPGAVAGRASVHAVVYSQAGALLGVGPATIIPWGDPARWRTMRLDAPGLPLEGEPWIGLRAFGVEDSCRLYGLETGAGTVKEIAAAQSAPASLAGAQDAGWEPAIFADVFDAWTPPTAPDRTLARLPWARAQQALATTGPLAGSRVSATCGWHGTGADPETGAFCVVRTGGPLSDLVGERLQVTYAGAGPARRVVVYCHDEQAFPVEFDEDLSLTRRAFMALAPLASDSVPVTVETLG